MTEIILTTIKDILNAEKDLLRNRYEGDFEYNQFKSHLKWRRLFLIFINWVLIVLAIYYILNITEKFFCLSSTLISFSLFFYSIFNTYNSRTSIKHFQYLDPVGNKIKKIEWSKWQLRDIIFKKPILLDENYKLCYELSTDRKYCLYLIVQYKDGSFGWYKITNDRELNQEDIRKSPKSDNNKQKIIFIEIASYKNNKEVEIKHKDIIQEMKKDGLTPELIVGIRIRSNIENQKIQILNLNFKENLSS